MSGIMGGFEEKDGVAGLRMLVFVQLQLTTDIERRMRWSH
jgi:hypothetical protein